MEAHDAMKSVRVIAGILGGTMLAIFLVKALSYLLNIVLRRENK